MPIEAGILKSEEEKKKKIITEKEKTFQQKKNIDLQQRREKAEKCEQTENHLNKLKNLLEDGKLDTSTSQLVEELTSSPDISQEQIQEIFDKIDEIENNEAVNKYLPEEARITKEDYQKSLTDDVFRIQTLTKLNTALTILAHHLNPDSSLGLNLFSGFMAVLDKNLILIQENHVDIKNSLENIEEKKNPTVKMGFWEKIKRFFMQLLK